MRFRDKDKECAKQMIIFHQNHLKAAAVLLVMQPEMGFFFFFVLFSFRPSLLTRAKNHFAFSLNNSFPTCKNTERSVFLNILKIEHKGVLGYK